MLSLNQILSYAKSKQLNRNILTEYLQHELLDSLFQQKGSEYFSFIGGTAIRICWQGRRFSQDLDFDTIALNDFDRLLRQTTDQMRLKGFKLEFRLIHKGAYHCHIKFPQAKLLIKVDATTPKLFVSTTHLVNKYGVFRTIKTAPPAVLLAKKLLTIQNRKRPKGRDLYDVTFLWGLSEPDLSYIKKTSGKSLNDLLAGIKKYVTTLNLNDLAKEVSPFLEDQSDLDRVRQFNSFLKTKML